MVPAPCRPATDLRKPFHVSDSLLAEMEELSPLDMDEEAASVKYGFPRNVSDIYRGEMLLCTQAEEMRRTGAGELSCVVVAEKYSVCHFASMRCLYQRRRDER